MLAATVLTTSRDKRKRALSMAVAAYQQPAPVYYYPPPVVYYAPAPVAYPVYSAPVGGSYVKVVNRGSGMCLDVKDISTYNGAAIQQWPCWDNPAQHWWFA